MGPRTVVLSMLRSSKELMLSKLTVFFVLMSALPASAMIGGSIATHPYEVQFGMCTGTMIAPNIILTAAHCVVFPAGGKIEVLAKAGQPIQLTTYAKGKQKYMTRIKGVAAHPSWETSLRAQSRPSADVAADSPDVSDVGVIVLADQIPSAYAQLPASSADLAGQHVNVFGAGCLQTGAASTIGHLKVASVPVQAISENRLLIGVEDSQTGQAAGLCRGDSGGGVFLNGQIVAVNSIIAGVPTQAASPGYVARLDRPEVIAWLKRVTAYKASGPIAAGVDF